MSEFERILELMEKNNVSAYKLSKATGISQGNIGNWRNGRSGPSYGAIVKIASFFNVSPEYLQGKTDIPMPAHAAYPGGALAPINTKDPQIAALLQSLEGLDSDGLRLVQGFVDMYKGQKK